MLDSLIALDTSLLIKIQYLIDRTNPWIIQIVRISADSQVILIALFLIALWIRGVIIKDDVPKRQSLDIFYTIMIMFGIYLVLDIFLPIRERPELASKIRSLVHHLPDNSFPSGHAIFAAASIGAVWTAFRSWSIRITFLFFGVLMVCARVIAGIHFPGDILVGWIIGSFGPYVYGHIQKTRLFPACYTIPIVFAKRIFL